MRQRETISVISERCGISKVKSKALLDALQELAIEEIERTGTFSLYKVGKLKQVKRKPRVGRNPTTGEEVKIPARKRVIFRVGKAFVDTVS